MGWMGDVVIDVKTDGETVSSATLVTEQCLLGEEALENVRTWRFEKHTPTVFRVTYHFRLFTAEAYSRNCEISLHLPFDVEVRAQGLTLVEEKRP